MSSERLLKCYIPNLIVNDINYVTGVIFQFCKKNVLSVELEPTTPRKLIELTYQQLHGTIGSYIFSN